MSSPAHSHLTINTDRQPTAMNIPTTNHLDRTGYSPWGPREGDAARLSIEHIRAFAGASLAIRGDRDASNPGPSTTQTKQATTEQTES